MGKKHLETMELAILAERQPVQVSFNNYEEVKEALRTEVEKYEKMVYTPDQLKAVKKDHKDLKAVEKQLEDKQKELKEIYSAPYRDAEAKLNELIAMVKAPRKEIGKFIDEEELKEKFQDIDAYAAEKAAVLGEYAPKVLESNAFKNPRWKLKTCKDKQWKAEIDGKISEAVKDIQCIQTSGGKHAPALLARYFETLSMEGNKEFLDTLENSPSDEILEAEQEEDQITGYKVLKITATETQMANLLNQMEMMGLDVEELEDGMPKPMEEKTEPDFDSFVAFDIETTGTFGAAKGDEEAGITEIGAVRVEGGKIVEKFDELANPGRKIVPWVTKITHITNDMIKDAPDINDVMKRFAEFCGDSVLVGHNIKASDLHYIGKAAKKAGVVMENKFLDTYLLAKTFKKEENWEKLNLGYLSETFGLEHKEAHRAWSDAEVNADVYFVLQGLFRKKEGKL